MAITYMTAEGYKKLKEEINTLETTERPAISKQIAEARDKGDLSENAEYDAAKEAQGLLEAKIAQMKNLLANARLINEDSIGTDVVQILNKVTIRNTKNNQKMTYTPIAQGLMGKKVGDIAEIKVPSGIMSFEIMDISL